MNGSVFVGNRALSINKIGEYAQITGVRLWVDDENVYEAGDESGVVLEANCPYATQEIANSVLSNVQGYQYKPVTATGAEVSPTAELGDAVTIGDTYTQLAKQNVRFSTGAVMDVSAPGSSEVDHEYKTEGAQTQQTNRKLAETRSLISKTAEEIQMLVESEIEDLSASITVSLNGINQRIDGMDNQFAEIDLSLDGITSTVNGLDGKITQVDQKVDSITLNVSNGSTSSTISLLVDGVTVSSKSITMSGLVTFTGLANGTTTINGACIKTGTIDADRLNLTGAITFGDLSYTMQNEINDISSTASSAASEAGQAYNLAEAVDNTVSGWVYPGSTMIDGSSIMTGTVTASTLRGGQVQLLNAQGSSSGHITIGSATSGAYAIELHSDAAMRIECDSGLLYLNGGPNVTVYCDTFFPSGPAPDLGSTSLGMWQEVFSYTAEINTSDANWKHDVEEVPEKYLDMLGDIVPVRYKMNNGQSNRYHIGFIAQNVKSAMDAHGVSDTDFAGWCQDVDGEGNEIQLLRYAEFIALLWAKIRNLEAKING